MHHMLTVLNQVNGIAKCALAAGGASIPRYVADALWAVGRLTDDEIFRGDQSDCPRSTAPEPCVNHEQL